MPARTQRPQRPPLTHFLCLPLLTPTSTPQLRASIAHLKSVIETLQPAVIEEENGSAGARTRAPQTRPLVPPAAFRPLGTLHLTLGVMSLKEPARLQGALKLLEDLDLEALLRDVSAGESSGPEDMVSGESALRLGVGKSIKSPGEVKEESSSHKMTETTTRTINIPTAEASEGESTLTTLSKPISPPPPVSKQSSELPLKPTSPGSSPSSTVQPKPSAPPILTISLRALSPFPTHSPSRATVLHSAPYDPTGRLQRFCLGLLAHFKAAGYMLSDQQADRERLTLHATLINTVYAKKSRDGEKKRIGKVTFDATRILRVFNEQGGDGSSFQGTTTASDVNGACAFTFASSISLNRVQICEMGAKRLDPEHDPDGLGEKYVVVGEKRILPSISIE